MLTQERSTGYRLSVSFTTKLFINLTKQDWQAYSAVVFEDFMSNMNIYIKVFFKLFHPVTRLDTAGWFCSKTLDLYSDLNEIAAVGEGGSLSICVYAQTAVSPPF